MICVAYADAARRGSPAMSTIMSIITNMIMNITMNMVMSTAITIMTTSRAHYVL